MGLNWSYMFGARVGCVWAKWAWVISGHTCLGPVRVMIGVSGHGLGLFIHVLGPCGFCLGEMGMGYNWSYMLGDCIGCVWAN